MCECQKYIRYLRLYTLLYTSPADLEMFLAELDKQADAKTRQPKLPRLIWSVRQCEPPAHYALYELADSFPLYTNTVIYTSYRNRKCLNINVQRRKQWLGCKCNIRTYLALPIIITFREYRAMLLFCRNKNSK